MWAWQQGRYILAGTFLMTLQPVLVIMSQNSDGKLDYNPVTSTLLSEVCKLGISLSMLHRSEAKFQQQDRYEFFRFAIPGAIYFVNNNLVFIILLHMNTTTFQLLGQLKTVFTGLLFRFFLNGQLTSVQWLAIWQLACGAAVSQIPAASLDSHGAEKQSSTFGLMLSILSCLLSAFGGIYSEKLLKKRAAESIHLQNAQLYLWGVLFNLVGACIHSPAALIKGDFFAGYNFWAWCVVLNNAFNGLAISAILKYADNIARVYAHAASMLITMLLSVLLFGQQPTPQLILAVAVVGASAVQYNMKLELAPPGVSAAQHCVTNASPAQYGRVMEEDDVCPAEAPAELVEEGARAGRYADTRGGESGSRPRHAER